MNTIPSRAHLGDKNLISVIIPAEIVNIEDWAYANCENLREIWIPCGCRVSNKAFVGCSSISSVHIYRNSLKADVNSYPELLGLAVRIWGSDTDLLISHASEDKDEIVRPLANALVEKGVKVWYDEFEMKIGDSLRRKIDKGLANSRFGIVVIKSHIPQLL